MGYITPDYYKNEYMGQDAGDQIERFIKRASETIDQVTGFKITDFDSLAPVVQEYVKKATAAQVEFYVVMGDPSNIDAGDDYSNFQIGGFQYSKGGASKNKQADRVSPAVWTYLEPTGLLYRGLDVVHNAFC